MEISDQRFQSSDIFSAYIFKPEEFIANRIMIISILEFKTNFVQQAAVGTDSPHCHNRHKSNE